MRLRQAAVGGAIVGGAIGGRRGTAIGAVTGPRWELTGGLTGAAIMVIGAGIISISGTTAVAGSAGQADDRIRYRIEIAAELVNHLVIRAPIGVGARMHLESPGKPPQPLIAASASIHQAPDSLRAGLQPTAAAGKSCGGIRR